MTNSRSHRPPAPATVWPARGRHIGPAAQDVVRRRLEGLTADGVLHSHLELDGTDPAQGHVFEARWQLPEEVTVRARLALSPYRDPGEGQEWLLIAEAERPWDPAWPSPATMFWPPRQGAEDGGWDHEAVTGLRLGEVNPLPEDDKELRRVLRHAVRDDWAVHVVVHEAMTPDEQGRAALVRLLPESLRHRVVEHRAAPHRLRAVNWVLDDFGTRVPRGGAVVLPGGPKATGHDHDPREFSVRSVFLDGTEPTEFLDAVTRFAALPRPLPQGGEAALTALREEWHLRTMEEELAHARELVAMYAEALEAMTRSRDLYRDAAERAHEALAVYREAEDLPPLRRPAAPSAGSPLRQLARGLGRLKESALSRRSGGSEAPVRVPAPGAEPEPERGARPGAEAGASADSGSGPGSGSNSGSGSGSGSGPVEASGDTAPDGAAAVPGTSGPTGTARTRDVQGP
ncbi:hypothetical protein [Streptomyces sp. NPDC004065]|uniref:hypothetical protein n=1 Tax=Streptomyces sp. NPDC004065 TaxID=3364689 RepID=UPI00384E093B